MKIILPAVLGGPILHGIDNLVGSMNHSGSRRRSYCRWAITSTGSLPAHPPLRNGLTAFGIT
ncbi:hypothetical protein MHZ95_08175 [Sporosarcina sp. ACRSM]|uniref:hypothetical protein n=1 Tax=Sporosarcina sp. ACRSM TaxID=2918216 RepID=UPI001EF69D6E|nr:hypothetical protein [Sporosarcina sp. ACRSM]MCG7335252.1 hypothetical protein [Sporosarcina sp. ACRSM]